MNKGGDKRKEGQGTGGKEWPANRCVTERGGKEWERREGAKIRGKEMRWERKSRGETGELRKC